MAEAYISALRKGVERGDAALFETPLMQKAKMDTEEKEDKQIGGILLATKSKLWEIANSISNNNEFEKYSSGNALVDFIYSIVSRIAKYDDSNKLGDIENRIKNHSFWESLGEFISGIALSDLNEIMGIAIKDIKGIKPDEIKIKLAIGWLKDDVAGRYMLGEIKLYVNHLVGEYNQYDLDFSNPYDVYTALSGIYIIFVHEYFHAIQDKFLKENFGTSIYNAPIKFIESSATFVEKYIESYLDSYRWSGKLNLGATSTTEARSLFLKAITYNPPIVTDSYDLWMVFGLLYLKNNGSFSRTLNEMLKKEVIEAFEGKKHETLNMDNKTLLRGLEADKPISSSDLGVAIANTQRT
jgi:hypothetical protein